MLKHLVATILNSAGEEENTRKPGSGDWEEPVVATFSLFFKTRRSSRLRVSMTNVKCNYKHKGSVGLRKMI